MKRPFQSGDRIVVYATLCGDPVRSKGTVLEAFRDSIHVEMDEVLTAKQIWAHPKQCRRLKPRAKPREWYVVVAQSGVIRAGVPSGAPLTATWPDKLVLVREAKK